MGKGFIEGSPGIAAGFSSRYGALCVLPTADSAQSFGQAGPCSACPCAGHTHERYTALSATAQRSTPQRSPRLLRAWLRDRGATGDWLRGGAGAGPVLGLAARGRRGRGRAVPGPAAVRSLGPGEFRPPVARARRSLFPVCPCRAHVLSASAGMPMCSQHPAGPASHLSPPGDSARHPPGSPAGEKSHR